MQNHYYAEQSNQVNYETFTYHKNPLIIAANPLLNTISQIRNSATNIDPEKLRQQLIESIRHFEIRAQRAGLPYEVIVGARYCLCTALDESAALTPWGSRVWSKNGLLVTFHNETWGGEKFFQLLAKLSQNPREHLFLLELLCFCLLLGFEGRYRVIENGRSQLETLTQRLLQLIKSIRGNYPAPLSLHGEDKPVLMKFWRPIVPLWAGIVLAGFLCCLVFITLNWRLGDATNPVLAAIIQTKIPHLTIKEVVVPPVQIQRLAPLLQNEIKAGIMLVPETAEESKVILIGDGMFVSGGVSLSEKYITAINRVVEEMDKLEGRIEVIGHTDDRPIRSTVYPSNWELSEARAKTVARLISSLQKSNKQITVTGLGSTKPVGDNKTPEGRAANRRVEIILYLPATQIEK